MPRADGLAAGIRTRFSSEYQPPNRGRKPSQLKSWIKENNVSSGDFIAIFTTIIATHTLEELEEMVSEDKKKKLPVIVALCISAFLRDMKTGTLVSANSILDRIMGKPTQQINFGSGGEIKVPDDPEERAALVKKLKKEIEIGSLVAVEKPKKQKNPAKLQTVKKTQSQKEKPERKAAAKKK